MTSKGQSALVGNVTFPLALYFSQKVRVALPLSISALLSIPDAHTNHQAEGKLKISGTESSFSDKTSVIVPLS